MMDSENDLPLRRIGVILKNESVFLFSEFSKIKNFGLRGYKGLQEMVW